MRRNVKKSIITDDLKHCIECGQSPAQLHHVFMGKNRRDADEDGLIIPLCMTHHLDHRFGIHFNAELRHKWQRIAQEEYEQTHSRAEFVKRYNRNYR